MATTGNEEVTDKDWMFDYLLSLLRSPQWDISIMGFIDENCAVFDTDDENKLSYTSLHRQFKDLVETLCSSSLADVGIGIEDFVDALEASKLRQDISKSVYEQLIAVDDFITFKKLMVKRNFELELEAVQALQEHQLTSRDGSVDYSIALMREGEDLKEDGDRGYDPGEEFSLPRGSPQDTVESEGTSALEKQLERAMEANLRELELMHKREEVEQAELEQAIAMSLALESNRSDPESRRDRDTANLSGSDDKDVGRSDRTSSGVRQADREGIDDHEAGSYARSVDGEATNNPMYAEEKLSSSVARKGEKEWKSLPPLSSTRHAGGGGRFRPALDANGENVRDPGVESTSRKRRACVASEKAQALLGERKCAQKVLKGQISEEETAQRERHLKEMRDRIISAKRTEREEQALKAKITPIHVQPNDAPESDTKRREEDVPCVVKSEEDLADEQRRVMRMALARRMKRELVETERDRLTKVREDQFADLNDKLCSVEKLRVENATKEAEIAQVLLHQQQQRARNMALSAAAAQRNGENEFTFGERG